MGLQAILDAIRADGLARVQEIERRARENVEGILAAAGVEAERLRHEARSAEMALAASECARIIQGARLEGLRIVGDERESLIAAALQQAREGLGSLRTDRSYPAILRRLTGEALEELGGSAGEGGGPRLAADAQDRALLNEVQHALGLALTVDFELACLGGVVAHSQDGRVKVINTLEARLARAEPFLRRQLGALFERGEAQSGAGQVRLAAEA